MLRFSLLNQLQGLDQSGEGAFVLQVPLALPMEAGKVSAPLRPCWLWGFCPSSQPSVVYAGWLWLLCAGTGQSSAPSRAGSVWLQGWARSRKVGGFSPQIPG